MSGAGDSGYAVYIDILFKDGKRLWGYTISFDTGTHGWQFKAGVIDPDVAIHSLQLYTMFRWHSGTAGPDRYCSPRHRHALEPSCFSLLTFIEPQGTHMVRTIQSPPPFQADRP